MSHDHMQNYISQLSTEPTEIIRDQIFGTSKGYFTGISIEISNGHGKWIAFQECINYASEGKNVLFVSKTERLNDLSNYMLNYVQHQNYDEKKQKLILINLQICSLVGTLRSFEKNLWTDTFMKFDSVVFDSIDHLYPDDFSSEAETVRLVNEFTSISLISNISIVAIHYNKEEAFVVEDDCDSDQDENIYHVCDVFEDYIKEFFRIHQEPYEVENEDEPFDGYTLQHIVSSDFSDVLENRYFVLSENNYYHELPLKKDE